jgi:aldose 1-epimerase
VAATLARGYSRAVAGVVPSGEQFEIAHGEQRATIVEVGGGVRSFAAAGRPILEPYPLEAMTDGAHGAPLIPWPNRLADGRYDFDGQTFQLAITEPERGNAIHGLLRWRSWQALERSADRVVMGIRLHPTPGYPFTLDVRIDYRLDEDGLLVATTATNRGGDACPYGAGQHPYLSPGAATIDDCTLELPAAVRVLTDERMLPCGYERVDGTPFDFRAGHGIGALELDSAFTELGRDARGRATVRLRGNDGACGELWVDEEYGLLELYSGDGLAPERQRRGLGVEPMTCEPNAFRSGRGLVRLEPGDSHTAVWGARLAPS